ncbi:MAG: DNA polymerase III subunit epsilon [Alphaproteobacteria bacterium]|nr:DNA polymerase III subunit epsilon [Alphaproteobacteria bacterium]MBV9694136.1 DNA polymerase III subunit epsilon [Alphaproteobacteria bacterium]
MREIVLDTETTGLDPDAGHRVVEIGCVELLDHFPTGRHFQRYLNPEREMAADAERVHGITNDFLKDKPLFAHIVEEFLEFIGDAPLVIHNAGFDLKFLNAELARSARPPLQAARAIDTIEIAKSKYPGARYSLDELCKRFSIDLSSRSLHGALLDAELTAQVYLELIGGRQKKLLLSEAEAAAVDVVLESRVARQRPAPLAVLLTQLESEAHALFVAAELGGDAVWSWP